ncbi:MAG: PHB depolymerase family esterase [Halioglobus sp.]
MKKASLALLLLLIGGVLYLIYFEGAPEPDLPGVLADQEVQWDGHIRRYTYYTPSHLARKPALVIVGHGSGGSAEQSRAVFGYAFEQLAEQYGFYVLYPEGYERHYNGCRKAGPYKANILKIDDVGFIRDTVSTFVAELGVDQSAVFATGISNGGQMALRLALEAPDLVAAVAPVATSMPSNENMDCTASGVPVAFLLMNGTEDPMNPYMGGTVALYGLLGDRGTVLSSFDTVSYWANLAGHTEGPDTIFLPDSVSGDNSTVEVRRWTSRGRKNVSLYTIVGGGHNAPHPSMRPPRIVGGINKDIVAAEEIWGFFQEAVE